MTITEHPLSTHDGLQNALTWSYKHTIFYTTSCFNIFNTRKFKCTQPRSTETLNKINGFKAWHGHWFWLCFSGVSVTFTRFFWREKLSLQQKHKKNNTVLVGMKIGGGSMSKHPYHPISFTHAQERSAKLRFRDLVMLAMRKCVFLDSDFKTHTWPLPFGKSKSRICYKWHVKQPNLIPLRAHSFKGCFCWKHCLLLWF